MFSIHGSSSKKEEDMQKRLYPLFVLFLAIGFALTGCGKSMQGPGGKSAKAVKAYAAKDFGELVGTEGFSDILLQNHFKLYQGYVKNTNMLLDQLNTLLKSGNVSSAEYSELKRRLGFEFNGMVLHELYFSNLGGKKALDVKLPLYDAIVQNFGSFDLWKKDFAATGAMRGIGWVVL
jgi:Fe-Mn family superoxide dismutase